MTFIEGIGDEVTAFFVILIVIVLATLVTFIGSGPHLFSPVHTRAVHIAVLSSRDPPEDVQSPESNHSLPNDNSDTSPPYESLTHWQASSTNNNNYTQHETTPQPNDTVSVEDISDDTEEQSSSDETRAGENDQSETPTAPIEEVIGDMQEDAHDTSAQGIRIRLKYLDDTERTVRSSPVTKIGDFKRNHFPEDIANNKVVRLIFCGHLLRDASTLESYRVVDNSVLHVQILQAADRTSRSAGTAGGQQSADPLDLSHLLWPLVSVILGVCWVFYFKYPEFFSIISLSLLFVFTASFFVFYTHVHH